jgi:hypothetical protein
MPRGHRGSTGAYMIDSIGKFLNAYEGDLDATIAFDFEEGRYLFGESSRSMKQTMDSGLTKRLERLGVIYLYAGVLKINPMAMRVLEEIRNDGKLVSEDVFRLEIEESKALGSTALP